MKPGISFCVAAFSFSLLCAPIARAASRPLAAEAVLTIVSDDMFAGVNPSPDGRYVAFDVSDRRDELAVDYSPQAFKADGYPMANGGILRARLVERSTGKTILLDSPTGVSWGGNWSPDGRYYAFYSNRSGGTCVWLWDSADGSTRQLSTVNSHSYRNTDRPLWTPDASEVIFKAVPEGMTLHDIQRLNPAYLAKDSAERKEAPKDSVAPEAHIYRSREPAATLKKSGGFLDFQYLSDMVAVSVKTGQVRLIAPHVTVMRSALSADGQWLAIITAIGTHGNTQLMERALSVYPVAGGAGRALAENLVMADPVNFSWSPDGTRIAFVNQEDGNSDATMINRCYVIDVKTGAKVLISKVILGRPRLDRVQPLWNPAGTRIWMVESFMPDNISHNSKEGHLWWLAADGSGGAEVGDFPGRSVQEVVLQPSGEQYWSPDGGASLVVATRDDRTKKEGFFIVDTTTGQSRLLGEYDIDLHRYPKGSPGERGHFCFFREEVGRPFELFSMNITDGKIAQLTNLHPAFADAAPMRSQVIDWRTTDGESRRGALLLPADYVPGHRYPLVTWVYGTRFGSDKVNSYSFGMNSFFNFQFLASRGYAIFYPDLPMHGTSPIHEVTAAVLPGINCVIELGIADPDRLAIAGHSYGGYNTLSLITQTNRFKAAIALSSGAADMFEGYTRFNREFEWFGYYEVGQGEMRGTPWEFPLRYFENSPFFYLDRVTTPLLLERGLEDPISSGHGSVYLSLKRLGKEVVHVEYEHEGHVFSRPATIVDMLERQLEWLDRHLQLPQDKALGQEESAGAVKKSAP